MQPDQDAPKENDQKMTPSPESGGQSFVSGDKPRTPKWLSWLLIILLVLVLLFGWWWFMMRDDKPSSSASNNNGSENSEQDEAAEAVCAEGLTNYENAELGFGFCYPTEWGTVEVVDAKLDPTDTGSRWNLSFSDKEEVNLGVASADWETSFGRDGVCSDPASPMMPSFSPFSTAWETFDEGGTVTTASRGIEMLADTYLIQEYASNTLAEVVCVSGYTVLDGTPYAHTSASYATTFNAAVPDPATHMASPNTLISVDERDVFYEFTKSVYDL